MSVTPIKQSAYARYAALQPVGGDNRIRCDDCTRQRCKLRPYHATGGKLEWHRCGEWRPTAEMIERVRRAKA